MYATRNDSNSCFRLVYSKRSVVPAGVEHPGMTVDVPDTYLHFHDAGTYIQMDRAKGNDGKTPTTQTYENMPFQGQNIQPTYTALDFRDAQKF